MNLLQDFENCKMERNRYKSKFLQIYANLPLNVRGEIVAVIDSEPVTWNSAKIEVENDTPKGTEILNQLVKLEILK